MVLTINSILFNFVFVFIGVLLTILNVIVPLKEIKSQCDQDSDIYDIYIHQYSFYFQLFSNWIFIAMPVTFIYMLSVFAFDYFTNW